MPGATQPSPELGYLVSLDHVNLRVTDQRLATLFFIEGLGLTRDPYRMSGTGNMWANMGQHQFHLPTGEPTPFPGEVGMIVPDLEAVRENLERVAPQLAETAFSLCRENGTLLAASPWGVPIRIMQAGAQPSLWPLALAYVELQAPRGSVPGIAAFYEEVLHAPCKRSGGKTPRLAVTVGPHQTLRFVERAGFEPRPDNNHIALYLTGYREIYARMEALGIVMEKDRNEQFRFADILDPKDGKRLLRFEHEMRSLYHGDYARPLVNRGNLGGHTGTVIGR